MLITGTIEQLYRRWHFEPFLRANIKVLEQPTTEPISEEDAIAHLRLTTIGSPPSIDDSEILAVYRGAAREWCEGYAGRAYAPQTLELGMSRFPGDLTFGYHAHTYITLPVGPVRGIDSISYTDGDGNEQTVDSSSYILDNYADPARVYLAPGSSWPSTERIPNAAKVRYFAGYDVDGDSPGDMPLPRLVRQAMLLMLGHFYENRENVIIAATRTAAIELPHGAAALLDLAGRTRTGFA
jgi:uncharacterized phiE125 gp8 family phage protein